MKKGKRVFHKLLFPGTPIIVLGVPLCAALLIYVFAFAHDHEPIAVVSYVLSAYVTVALCVRMPELGRGGLARLHQNPYVHRYLTDVAFRAQLSLRMSLGINLFYAITKLVVGVCDHSVWWGTFGVYYALLAVMRFALLRHVKPNSVGRELISELKRYRLCGVILIPMNIVLCGVVVLAVREQESFIYAGTFIYVVAMYAFYAVAAAVGHLIRYRTYQSPAMSAAKAVSLAAALVSIFSLETAMLEQFGDGQNPALRNVMVALTGAGVLAIILGMAVFMIVYATRRLEALQRPVDTTGGDFYER